METVKLPKKYRNRIYQWTVTAPFDGCLWTLSHGVVDGNGDYHPVNAGKDLNLDAWFMYRRNSIQGDIEECQARLQELKELKQNTLNAYFLETLQNSEKTGAGVDTGHIDSTYIETPFNAKIEDIAWYDIDDDGCLAFARSCGDDMGMVCSVLDTVANYDYDPVCKCCSCGEIIRASNIESFESMLDHDSYRGNGGIGVVCTSVLCEECLHLSVCAHCDERNIPCSYGEVDYDDMTFAERFMFQWLGICSDCTEDFLNDNKEFLEELDNLEKAIAGQQIQLSKYLTHMRAQGVSEDGIRELRIKNEQQLHASNIELVNELRSKMQREAENWFNYGTSLRVSKNDKTYVF